MNDLIEKRDERTKRRKEVKRKMDSIIGLSYNHEKHTLSAEYKLSGGTARLLDEGYIDNGFVIKKGTLEKFLNGQNQYVRAYEFNGEEWEQSEVLNLTSDFVGTVNLGHMDFATMPFILGTWTKEDLTLIDIENDRKALDVTLHLDEESMFIQELRRQNHDIGISAEFWVHQNDEDTENLSETLGYYLPVFDEVFISAYALVGECGNVNSSGLELKENAMLDETNKVIPTENDEIEVENDEVEVELAVEEKEAISEEAVEEEDIEVEEVEVEEVIEEDDDEDEDDEDEFEDVAESISELNARVTELEAENAKLKEHLDALKKDNRRLSAKLQKEKEKKEAFFAKAKGISVKMGINEDIKVTNGSMASGDGIGD